MHDNVQHLRPNILVVDDDAEICALLKDYLLRRGMRVSLAHDEAEMQHALAEGTINLIILDLMLPGKSGLELCHDIRLNSNIPIIMLTAIADTGDRIVGLEVGADDYLSKPFDPRELLARIRAVLRRHQNVERVSLRTTADRQLHFAGWRLDLDRNCVIDPFGIRIELTRAEYLLLQILIEAKGRVLSREQLIESCGRDASHSFDRSIDILVSRLRRKLQDDPKKPALIETVRGGGYRFISEGET